MAAMDWQKDFSEKLRKIQSYLSVLPKVDTVKPASPVSRSQSRIVSESEREIRDTESSSGSTWTRITPKKEYGELLQSRQESYNASGAVLSSVSLINTKKKKKRERKTIDPLRPTKKRSFGVDIGQGINTIKFIKENSQPPSDRKQKRLLNIFSQEIPKLKTQKSLENIFRQGPLSEASATSVRLKASTETERRSPEIRSGIFFREVSSEDLFRITYKDYVTEIANDYGLDTLQGLFVIYHLED